jgi:hypothetical protein
MLCRGLDLLDKLEAQEENKEKKREEDKVTSTAMQLAATAVELPNDFSGLSSEELLVFKSSLWGLIAGGGEIPPVSRGS